MRLFVKGWNLCARRLNRPDVTDGIRPRKAPAVLAALGIISGLALGFNAKASGLEDSESSIAAARAYVQLVSTAKGDVAAAGSSAQAPAHRIRLADADFLVDDLKQLFDKDSSAPERPASSQYAPPRARGSTGESPHPDATFVGPKVCLGCHVTQANTFGRTLMGRIVAQGDHGNHNQPKLECETCHGPGSVHVRYAGCAGCHGEGGNSTRAGIPTLAGQAPDYLASAIKSFTDGSRKHEIMGPIASRLSAGEIKTVAHYYSGQVPARAETPLLGNPAGGKELAASTCSACHGDKGTPATVGPRLAGQNAQYLVAQLTAFREGRRKNETMNAMAASLDEKTIHNVASYYASLEPGRPAGKIAGADAPVPAVIGDLPALIGRARGADGSSVGGIISFRSDDPSRTPAQNNAVCLNCHERGDRAYWKGSTHETRNVACTNCHTIMKSVSAKAQLKTAWQPETCFQCHKDRRAQFMRSSHMPMREGKVVCTDCHNPHGSASASLLRTDTINETCYKCHAEKRGPFLFEHLPVRENCLNCHDPHGSINEMLLKLSRPRLCYECHTIGHGSAPIARPGGNGAQPGTPGKNNAMMYAVGRACNNCHTQIHGSNNPNGGLFHR